MKFLRRQLQERIPVRPVHGQDQVEILEIGEGDPAGALLADIDAAKAHRGLGAVIRRIADVPASKPGGIHSEVRAEAALSRGVAEYPFGDWRAADIPETDE